MKMLTLVLAIAGLFAAASAAPVNAQSSKAPAGLRQAPPPVQAAPQSAFFLGVGGSYNSVDFHNQNVYAQGVSNVFQGSTQVASGLAGGPADPFSLRESTLAPSAQIGFLRRLPASDWLWGAKFSYSYLRTSATNQNVIVPQVGSFTSATPDTFTGNVVVRSYQAGINHQMILTPFIGKSFERGYVYGGVGPSLSQTFNNLNGVIGFADINGTHQNITGAASNFSSTQWVWGGAAVVGATYFIDPTWFVDVSYTYAMTQNRTNTFSGPFTNTSLGYTTVGILSGNYSGKVITQALTVSLNKAFDF